MGRKLPRSLIVRERVCKFTSWGYFGIGETKKVPLSGYQLPIRRGVRIYISSCM